MDFADKFNQFRSPLKEINHTNNCDCGDFSKVVFNCIVCKIPMHRSEECSVSYENSEDIDSRICLKCNSTNNLKFSKK